MRYETKTKILSGTVLIAAGFLSTAALAQEALSSPI